MDVDISFVQYVASFLVVLSIVVFFHEWGHFLIARINGVRVDVFSIGFGREVFGFTDKKTGTRWKFSLIPLGGYVKMFGDADAASTKTDEKVEFTAEEKAVSFHHKKVGQRAAIVAAGPIANFILAIILFTGVFMLVGRPTTESLVSEVVPGSAAEMAGVQVGDLIVRVDDQAIERFADIQRLVHLSNGEELEIVVIRNGVEIELKAEPEMVEAEDNFGNEITRPVLGIKARSGEMESLGPVEAFGAAVHETYTVTVSTLTALGQMVTRSRSSDELGGPLRIAQFAGQAAEMGVVNFIMLTAILSVNLGLINLFPVPLLDGGHLLFYGIEAVLGRPLGEKAQEYGFRVGLVLVFSLMIFSTWNDLNYFKVVDFFKDLLS